MLTSIFTSPVRVVAKYCVEYAFMGLSVSVRENIVSPEPHMHARSLPIFVHVAYVRGSVLHWHVYDRPHRHRLSPGRVFLPQWKCIISRESGMWVRASRAKYAIDDCVVWFVFIGCIVLLYTWMRPNDTDREACMVCRSVCHTSEASKNGWSRCRLGWGLGWDQETV